VKQELLLQVWLTRRQLLSLLAGVPLAACASGGDLQPLPAPPSGPYVLGAGDTIRLIVFGQKQLTDLYDVDDSGVVDLPLIGVVAAAGLTATQLARKVSARLKADGLLLHPSVAVEIKRYRPFYILGEVNKPGQYRFVPGMTVLTAASLAGGFTYRAIESYVGIIRVAGGHPEEYRAKADALVEPGDVVKVFERHF
jgi:polysaccharide export outer membrane protein